MKKLIILSLVICALTEVTLAQSVTATGKKAYSVYNKYVNEPLKQSAAELYGGSVSYKMLIYEHVQATPATYTCHMEYTRWPMYNSVLPRLSLTIGDSVKYIMQNDSIYEYNLKNNTCKTGDFNSGLAFLTQNPFICFYAMWYELHGNISSINIYHKENMVQADWIYAPKNETKYSLSKAGTHTISYTTDNQYIQSYSYTPKPDLQSTYGYAKTEYELLTCEPQKECAAWTNLNSSYKNAFASDYQRQLRMTGELGINRENTIKTLNVGIDMNTKGKNKTEYHFPYFE